MACNVAGASGCTLIGDEMGATMGTACMTAISSDDTTSCTAYLSGASGGERLQVRLSHALSVRPRSSAPRPAA